MDSTLIRVGTTGFEPATTRPPDVCATGLRYVPNKAANVRQISHTIKHSEMTIFGNLIGMPGTGFSIF